MWEIECYWNSCWDTIIPRLIANHIQACTWDLFLTWKLLYVTKNCQKLPICYHMFHKSECLTIFSEAEHCCWEQSGEPPLKKKKNVSGCLTLFICMGGDMYWIQQKMTFPVGLKRMGILHPTITRVLLRWHDFSSQPALTNSCSTKVFSVIGWCPCPWLWAKIASSL